MRHHYCYDKVPSCYIMLSTFEEILSFFGFSYVESKNKKTLLYKRFKSNADILVNETNNIMKLISENKVI